MENKANQTDRKVYVITGPTSGIGHETALELAKYGKVILVGRNPEKLDAVQKEIEKMGQNAVSIVCDFSDMTSAERAANQIIALKLPIAGLLNNAGISPSAASKNARGWDMTYATNYLGPFMFTEALVPHLPDGANVVFIASAIEDPDRKPVKALGMKGARFISVEASARGEWKPGGTKVAGADAYATSKQSVLAAAMALARENKRLHINAIEPGITPGTGLNRDLNVALRSLGQVIMLFPPFAKYRSTPKRAAKMIAKIVTDASGKTGVYFDEKGEPMLGSKQVSDPEFQDAVLSETRAFLSEAKNIIS